MPEKTGGFLGRAKEPEILADRVVVPFDPTICGFRTIKFDNSAFFSRLRREEFNGVFDGINNDIRRASSTHQAQISTNPFARLTSALQVATGLLTTGFAIIYFLLDSDSQTVRSGMTQAATYFLLTFVGFFFMAVITSGFVFGYRPQFVDLQTTRQDIVGLHLKRVSPEFSLNGYSWHYLDEPEVLVIQKAPKNT
jgi:hypothetical protein